MTPNGMALAAVYEINLPRERQVIIDDRIRGELADPNKKTDIELESMRRYLGLTGKRK